MANKNKPTPENYPEDFSVKETSPNINGGNSSMGPRTAFDLVEEMLFLYVKIERARNLPALCDPFVEISIGNYKGTTQSFQKTVNWEWGTVFAFAKDQIQAIDADISLLDRGSVAGDPLLGRVVLSVGDAPLRAPPDSQLASQWYNLESRDGSHCSAELMLSIWMGTQADSHYPSAWHSDAAAVSGDGLINTHSKVYHSPKLWYLRITVIEAQDLLLTQNNNNKKPQILVEAKLGKIQITTKVSDSKNPSWNEDIILVAAEPFEKHLQIRVLDIIAPNRFQVLGICRIPVEKIDIRLDPSPACNQWYNLEKPVNFDGEITDLKEIKFASKVHMRVSLDGGYHVIHEPISYASDLRPTAKALWRPLIGVLELGILRASGFCSMKIKENRTDAFCVAKYGPKWVRTRTVANSLAPKWNEQYIFEVYDPCTVITIGVFDNGFLQGGERGVDTRIGKVRIRLSTMETDRIYSHFYPLVTLSPQGGVKKMGEIELAVRFSCSSLIQMLQTYSLPPLPELHYLLPLSIHQLENLRHQSFAILCDRLSRSEPKLREEVIRFILDADSHLWSLRKSRANFHRIASIFNNLIQFCKWVQLIQTWTKPTLTITAHIIFLLIVFFPELILPTTLFYCIVIGIWRFRSRPRHPFEIDTKLSQAFMATRDELEEEFDSFPSKAVGETLRRRYDRLRHVAGKLQAVMGDFAMQGERVEALLSWRDPRATAIFLVFCVGAAMAVYAVSFKVLVVLMGFYGMRHPCFRLGLPSFVRNFLRRLPARMDGFL